MKDVSRREFAKTSFALGATTALGSMRVLGANDRVNLALIGCGDRGQQVWNFFLKQADLNPVAVADVYTPNMNKAAEMAAGKAAAFNGPDRDKPSQRRTGRRWPRRTTWD